VSRHLHLDHPVWRPSKPTRKPSCCTPKTRIASTSSPKATNNKNLVGSLAFNVQDCHWLVYCALGGHQHADLPETDLLTGVSVLDFYSQAA
jgi:hypothetical protein